MTRFKVRSRCIVRTRIAVRTRITVRIMVWTKVGYCNSRRPCFEAGKNLNLKRLKFVSLFRPGARQIRLSDRDSPFRLVLATSDQI